MKRSNIFLTLALTLPIVLTMIGAAASTKPATAAADGSATDDDLDRLEWLNDGDKNAQIVVDETVKIGDSVLVQADAARLTVAFDPNLSGEAKVTISARRKEGVDAVMRQDRLEFRPSKEHRDGIKVNLVLPAKMASLQLVINASKCDAEPKGPVEINSFKVELNAGSCELDFARLVGDDSSFTVNAGNLEFETKALESRKSIETLVNAGKLSWRVHEIVLPKSDVGSPTLKFTNALGNSEIDIDRMPEHSIIAKTSMGNLEVKRGGKTEHRFGMNDEWQVEGPAGAPAVTIDVSMGDMDIDLD